METYFWKTRYVLRWVLFFGGTMLISIPGVLLADAAARAETIVPERTTVLLLPALDVTAEARNMLGARQAVIRHRQQVEFVSRRFRVAGEVIALKAAAESPVLDLTTTESRSVDNLDVLARRTGADWVVHTVVESAEGNSGDDGFAVDTRITLQVWDARNHKWILNGPTTGRFAGSAVPPMLFMRSLDAAAKESLQSLLAAVPVAVRLRNEDGITDYLANQTVPVSSDDGLPFVTTKIE